MVVILPVQVKFACKNIQIDGYRIIFPWYADFMIQYAFWTFRYAFWYGKRHLGMYIFLQFFGFSKHFFGGVTDHSNIILLFQWYGNHKDRKYCLSLVGLVQKKQGNEGVLVEEGIQNINWDQYLYSCLRPFKGDGGRISVNSPG